jgi:hypothetical protein
MDASFQIKKHSPFLPVGKPMTCNLVLITSNGQTKVAAITPGSKKKLLSKSSKRILI